MNIHTKVLDYTMIALATVSGCGSIILLIGVGLSGYWTYGWSPLTILLWDAALSLVFFVQHSWMVRASFQARLAGVVPDRYQGAVYTIASGVALAIVVLFWQGSPDLVYRLEGILLWFARTCSVLAIAALVVGAYSLRSFDPLGIGPIRAHLCGSAYQPMPFVVRGAYRWVRHPLYAGILVLFWMTPEVTADRLLFNVLWTGWISVGTFLEERDLVRAFGSAYLEYQQKVPMFFPWRPPAAASL